jgi:hypothetical protein
LPNVNRRANIGAKGRRRRLIGGAVWLVAGAIATAVIQASNAPEWWWATLVVPFTLAALGYFQAREST